MGKLNDNVTYISTHAEVLKGGHNRAALVRQLIVRAVSVALGCLWRMLL